MRKRKKQNRKVWIISDTHIGHSKLIQKGFRPIDNDEKIKRFWQSLVFPEDIIYHLGDVFLGKKKFFASWMEDLPGTKILLRGNHDKESMQWYLNKGFAAVLEYASLIVNMKVSNGLVKKTRVLLSHKPLAIPEYKDMHTINIHGHFHDSAMALCSPLLIKLLTKNHYLFSLERAKWKPQLLNRTFLDNILIQGE